MRVAAGRDGSMGELILVVNPGSTSTRLALYDGEACLVSETLPHDLISTSSYLRVADQLPVRLAAVRCWLHSQLVRLASADRPARLAAIASRGGLMRPLASGTYRVDGNMVADLRRPDSPDHASNLAVPIAAELMREHRVPAYCVDPVSVDELEDVARLSGLPELERRSLSHALSLKAVARRAAADLGRRYEDLNLVAVHMGSGISVSAHQGGRMVDVNNANDQGPFSPERAGTLPLTGLVRLIAASPSTDWRRKLLREGGLVAHLGTNDARQVEQRIAGGDQRASLVYRAMAYQVAKEIGAMAAALGTAPDAIVITGGLANSTPLVDWIRERVSFLGPVLVYPGSEEMSALAAGVLRVLRGEEQARTYGNCDLGRIRPAREAGRRQARSAGVPPAPGAAGRRDAGAP